MDVQDKELLVKFLKDLKKLLSQILEEKGTFRGEWLQLALKAYSELSGLWEEAQSHIHSGEYDTRLDQVGLSGVQLRVKLAGFNNALAATVQLPGGRVSRWKIFRRALKWANIILGSLVKALTRLELIKEFKECVEEGLEEAIEDTGG